jgi:hypothetical protein
MKKNLLIIIFLSSITAFGQNKITSNSTVSYDETGVHQYVDSFTYTYNTWQGSINELKPKFMFAGDIFGFNLDEVFVHCNQMNNYNGSPSSVSLSSTINNTLTGGFVTEANNSGVIRSLYQYNNGGQVISNTTQFFNGSIWESQDSTTNTYDGIGNKLTTNYYYFVSGTLQIPSIDSMWYVSGTNRLNKHKNYSFNFSTSTLELSKQTLVSYIGSNIQYLDLYAEYGSGLEWVSRFNYNYTGANCTGFVANYVVSNLPTTTVFATATFSYTAQNQPFEYTIDVGGSVLGKYGYDYYTDGFLKNENYYDLNSSNALYLYEKTTYYYQNTTSIEKIVDATVSIFPNPTMDIITIQSESSIISIQILNLNGQVLIDQKSNKVNLSHLPSGAYIIHGSTESGNFSKKIIKE